MYGIYANIWGILMVNVTIYTIHGSYGCWNMNGSTNFVYRNSYFYAPDCLDSSSPVPVRPIPCSSTSSSYGPIHEGFHSHGGTPNHPNFSGIFHYKPSILGYPHLWKPSNMCKSQKKTLFFWQIVFIWGSTWGFHDHLQDPNLQLPFVTSFITVAWDHRCPGDIESAIDVTIHRRSLFF